MKSTVFYTQDIDEAEQQFIPSTPVTRKFTNIETETKRIISLRNANRRQFQRTKNQDRKVLYRKLSKMIAIMVQKIRNIQFQKDIRSMPRYSKPFWRLPKSLKA